MLVVNWSICGSQSNVIATLLTSPYVTYSGITTIRLAVAFIISYADEAFTVHEVQLVVVRCYYETMS
jgi:hypothetical protein